MLTGGLGNDEMLAHNLDSYKKIAVADCSVCSAHEEKQPKCWHKNNAFIKPVQEEEDDDDDFELDMDDDDMDDISMDDDDSDEDADDVDEEQGLTQKQKKSNAKQQKKVVNQLKKTPVKGAENSKGPQTPKDKTPKDERDAKSLYVGKIPKNVTMDMVKDLSPDIMDVRMKPCKDGTS
ncbi:hypothetical protein NPIL_406171 [Nephila pilipes]|uniref:Vps72/YL1 N-terminal domain-containing protein n=1 Tax=Nephila pilipes TaxID=299642 RepID=A0A8X6QAC6_NEPPI|nr:hypothetical protein NPIL_406171 [Nephila pilipes]